MERRHALTDVTYLKKGKKEEDILEYAQIEKMMGVYTKQKLIYIHIYMYVCMYVCIWKAILVCILAEVYPITRFPMKKKKKNTVSGSTL